MMRHDEQQDVRALHGIRTRLEAAENTGDADYISSMLGDDAVLMVPSYPVQEGRTACAAFVRDVLSGVRHQFRRHITYVSAEVRVIGDWAFDRGRFSFTVAPKSGGRITRVTGKYLWLYADSGKGSWKLARLLVSLDEDDEEDRTAPPRLKAALAAVGRWLTTRWRRKRM